MDVNWVHVANCCGCDVGEIPTDLVEIIENLDCHIKNANGWTEDSGLRSTQIIGLMVMLWEMRVLKALKDQEMAEKSCQTCIHRWVCGKWGAALKYIASEWAGTAFEQMVEGLGLLLGKVCPRYQEAKGAE